MGTWVHPVIYIGMHVTILVYLTVTLTLTAIQKRTKVAS